MAEIASIDNEFVKSDSLYQEAFKLVKNPFKEDLFLAGLNADKLNNNCKVVYEYLKKGINNGLTLKRIKKAKFQNFKKAKQYQLLKKEYTAIYEQYLKTLNLSFRNDIITMVRKDQKARTPILGSWKQSKKTDSYNFKRLLEIIKENNNKWPGFSTIGEITPKGKYNVADNIALMLLHFKKDEIETLKFYMLQAVLEGEMYPYHYARILDYSLMGNIKIIKDSKNKVRIEYCFIYGSYSNSIICDCEKAEIERKKIGFEPLKDYFRKINSTYKCKE